uniref:Uncharacterized protein n=1 Tax=Spongospora subterranea TaxID=70186 RepID=A0A0H5RT47_9EUKA|eukprot:CRZ11909.1 hypothetical protein [Spongospora subterranea]
MNRMPSPLPSSPSERNSDWFRARAPSVDPFSETLDAFPVTIDGPRRSSNQRGRYERDQRRTVSTAIYWFPIDKLFNAMTVLHSGLPLRRPGKSRFSLFRLAMNNLSFIWANPENDLLM